MKNPVVQKFTPFVLLLIVAVLALFVPQLPSYAGEYSAADIAWILVATALVFIMTPGLAFFYGGMVHRKNIISTMIKSMVSAGIVSVIWVTFGYSLCFGESINGVIGNPMTHLFFKGVVDGAPTLQGGSAMTIPLLLFALFQLMFAIITPGLVVGAVAERIKFTSYALFIILFIILVYAPLAHWSWHPQGFLFKMGALDFAGGTVVHISAGCAALAGAIVLKSRRSKLEQQEIPPANIPYVLIGTGLLWFGWFGFNAGSALGANALSVNAFATTNTAAAAAGLAWMFFDVLKGKKPSVLGFCIGAVVGLVAITPAAGFVGIPQSIFIGLVAAIISNVASHAFKLSRVDDTLDVFPCHGIGGMVGMLMTGIFASKYSFSVSFVIFKFIATIMPLRVTEEDEELGLDASQHDEKYGRNPLKS
ncbi:MAG: ammonium transporter [Chitinophagia bacterium]|nr:ammonium transporter [Chitinophagia bacterium]